MYTLYFLSDEPNSPNDAKFCQHYVDESTGHESIVSWTSISEDASNTEANYDFNESDGEQLLAELYRSNGVGSLSMKAELQALRRDLTVTEAEQQQEDHEVKQVVDNDRFLAVVDDGSSPVNIVELNNNSSGIVSHCATSADISCQSIPNHDSSVSVANKTFVFDAKIHPNQLVLERCSSGSALRVKPEVLKELASQFSRLSSSAESKTELEYVPVVNMVRHFNSIIQKEDSMAIASVSMSQNDATLVTIPRTVSGGVDQTVPAQTSVSSLSSHWSSGQHKFLAGDPWAGFQPKNSNDDQWAGARPKTCYSDQWTGARPKTSSSDYLTQQTGLTPGNDSAGQISVMLPLFVDCAVLSDEETEESSPLISTVESCDYKNNETFGLELKPEEKVDIDAKEARSVERHGSDTVLANMCEDASQRDERDVEKQCDAEEKLLLNDEHFAGLLAENTEPVSRSSNVLCHCVIIIISDQVDSRVIIIH
jgi:hypothetical protein